jgi:cell division protein FtsL
VIPPARATEADLAHDFDAAPAPGAAGASPAPDLRVYSPEDRFARSERRRARILLAMAAAVIAIAFLIVGAANIVVTSRQFHVDSLSAAVSAAVVENQDLQLQRAQLETPQRIISIAEHRLGMVMPKSVTYLPAQPLPPVPAASHASAHKPAAAKHGDLQTGRRAPTR